MKALTVHGFDGPDHWRLEQRPMPEPGPGQVRVTVQAASISYVDLLLARGGYQLKPQLPFIPGTEFCGVIDRVGPGVSGHLRSGQRVTGTAFGGCWAEQVCAAAHAVHPIDGDSSAAEVSGLAITHATALYALQGRAALQAGEVVLVLGGAGGVGVAAVQVARAMGAQVIAGVGGRAKVQAVLAAGAHQAVDTAAADWRDQLRALAPGGAVDVVLDPVGGAATEAAFRSLRWGGRHLVVGFAAGAIPALKTNLALLKGASLVGVDVRQLGEREPAIAQSNLAALCRLVEQGAFRPLVAQVLPAERWADAMRLAADRATVGRVVIDWA